MLGLMSQATANFADYRRQWEELLLPAPSYLDARPSRLIEVTGFEPDPGNLRMLSYVPDDLLPGAPLVVILHGCTQTAAAYDHGAGWSALADRLGFALLLPEQQRVNNPNSCFTWFAPDDSARGRGEPLSIRQHGRADVLDHGLDRRRVYISGLSAGGAMTSVMLATYPELFAGGALLAGLPYRCAVDLPQALRCMAEGRSRPAADWGDLVRAASPHRGRGPSCRSGTAPPTRRCGRSTPRRSSSSGPTCTGWGWSRRSRTRSMAARAASGMMPPARRWSRPTWSPAWATACPCTRAPPAPRIGAAPLLRSCSRPGSGRPGTSPGSGGWSSAGSRRSDGQASGAPTER